MRGLTVKSPAFAKQLRKLRRQTGLSQEKFANIWGVSRERMSFYERQHNLPASRLLVQLNLKFGVNCFDWLSECHPPAPKYEIQITTNLNQALPTGKTA